MNSSSKLLAAVLTFLAVSAQARVLEDTVAEVNGAPILLSEYQKEIDEVMDYWRKAMPAAAADPAHVRKLRETTLEQLINREVLHQEGVKLKLKVHEREIESGLAEIKERFAKDDEGLPVSQAAAEAAFNNKLKVMGLTLAQFRERLSRQIMGRKVVDEVVKPRVKLPEEKTAKDYFDRLKAFLVSGSSEPPKDMSEEEGAAFLEIAGQMKGMTAERVRVSRILFRFSAANSSREKKRALKAAQETRRRLVEGNANFAEVAREVSEEAEFAARGGDIGLLIHGAAPPEFEKAAFSLGLGEISEPIETEIGYFIIRAQEKRAAEELDFDKFKDELARAMQNIAFQRELDTYVKSLKAQAGIERTPPPL